MAQGLQCWDANGNLTLDLTDRLTRVLGQFETGTTDGSITNEDLATGEPWFFCMSDNLVSSNYEKDPLTVTVNNTTISWAFDYIGADRVNKKFMYGVY